MEAYPLQWPDNRARTNFRHRSRFNVTLANARDGLLDELRQMGAQAPVLSTNIPVRRDGLPYASMKEPADPGVAIYFTYKKHPMAFSCDRWDLVRDNIQAMRHSIAALRGLDRWGTGDMVDAAFRGFEALPPPNWRNTLGLQVESRLKDAEKAFRDLACKAHPDLGGSEDKMILLNDAIKRARVELAQ